VREYYERRAPEYDDWYLGTGLHAVRERPGWAEELAALIEAIEALAPGRTLDVACGTGFLTRHLPGSVVALDGSLAMLEQARVNAPKAVLVHGDALALPFPNDAFHRVFSAHFYGHLEEDDRPRFLGEARRVGRELVVVDSARNETTPEDEWQDRVLSDGSRWQVFKRWFTADGLARELGGGETIFAGRWFVAVGSS
jgi:ubiquinone/menaquinone biosynthesis C-methylase UbiE